MSSFAGLDGLPWRTGVYVVSAAHEQHGAFHEAAKLGYRYIETDVRATRDGVAVILHDRRLGRDSGVPGAIDQLDWRDARNAHLGAGESIPTLEELLTALPDMRVNIDIKAASAIEPTVDVVERLNAHNRVLITSFSDRRRRRALRLLSRPVASSAGTGTLLAVMAARTPRSRAYAWRVLHDSDCLQVPPRLGGVPIITRDWCGPCTLRDGRYTPGRSTIPM